MSQTTHLTRRRAVLTAGSRRTVGRAVSMVMCVASNPNFRYSARMPRFLACTLPVS